MADLTITGEVVDVEAGSLVDAVTKQEKHFFAWFLKNPDKRSAPLRFGVSKDDYPLVKVGDTVTFTPTIGLSDFPGRKVGLNLKVISNVRISGI